MLNKIVINGRCVADPEVRVTPKGTEVATVTVAVDRDFASAGGERETDFIPVVAWRQTGVFLERHFKKGQLIIVSGSLQSRKWQDREGNNRVSWEVVADSVHFCGDKKSDANVSAADFTDLGDDEGTLPF